MNAHDHLQDALARLETGEALEHVLPTVAQDEADLLRTAAALQMAAQVAPDEKKRNAQRAALLHTANATIRQPNRTVIQRRGWIAAMAGTAAMLGVCGLFLLAGSLLWWQTSTAKSSAPGNTARLAPNPQTAVLDRVQGAVEITAADNQWVSADGGALLKAGQSVRTQALSSVTMIFYDGSRVTLGPKTDLTVNALDAEPAGQRIVQLSQTSGTSLHRVAKSPTIDSIYEVTTPSGVGRAKGTEFQVTVSAQQVARFDVSKGAVTVVNANTTVLVAAGQSTTVSGQQPPAAPVSYFSGAGELQSMGAVWVIAGQALLVSDETVIEGDPRVGDWVSFEGRTEHNGSRLADRITLIHRALINTFSFVGVVEAMGTTTWTVSGRTVQIEAQTQIDAGLAAGDAVEVTGRLAKDGSFVAETIQRLTPTSEAAFDFTGVVESIDTEEWTVSGLTVTVNLSTTIAPDLAVNDVVRVTGTIQADGTWQAVTIDPAGETGAFDFSGVIISLAPWNVSGAPFETDARTVIDDGVRVGNRVRVQGQVLPDGTWLADRITQIDHGQRHAVQFTALVQSIAPWVIGNVTVTVDSKTKIIGQIDVGDLVTVKGNLLPDGTVVAKSITRVSQTEPTATPAPTATPEITPTLTLTPTLTPTPTVTPEGTPTAVSGESVTLCHIPPGNPNNAKTITVGQGAVAAHLAHGDTLGPCPDTSPAKKKP